MEKSFAKQMETDSLSDIARSVLKTITFFDAQDLALTLMEIQTYLVNYSGSDPASLDEIVNSIERNLSDFVKTDGVFYYLTGREKLCALRRKRYKISLQRFRKTRKYLYFLQFIPFVRGIAVSGSQALMNSRKTSDIDLFITTKRNRIWLTRFLVSAYFQVLGVRRHGDLTQDRFCLNHYLEENKQIENDRNLYTAVEYASLIPVFGIKSIKNFYENNQWIKDFLAKPVFENKNIYFSYSPSLFARFIEFFLEISAIAYMLNKSVAWYQKYRIKRIDHVLVSDTELSFHPNSKGQKILSKFSKKYNSFSA